MRTLKILYLFLLCWVICPVTTMAQTDADGPFMVRAAKGINLLKVQADLPDTGQSTNIQLYLTIPGTDFLFQKAVCDNTGTCQFYIPSFYQDRQLVIQPDPEGPPASVRDRPVLIPFLRGDKVSHSEFLVADTFAFYGRAAYQYQLDHYTRFPTMEEVFREIVTEVRIRKNGAAYGLKVLNKSSGLYFDKTPLILMDGLPVFDINKLMELDPLGLRKIEVVPALFYSSGHEYEGIISMFSNRGDLAGYPVPANALITVPEIAEK